MLSDYSREGGHSLEQYGTELGFAKGDNKSPGFFKQWSQELEDYCIQDVELTHKVYLKYYKFIYNPAYKSALKLEHKFQLICNELTSNGFAFNKEKAEKLLVKVKTEMGELDEAIESAFPPRLKLIREIHPKLTQHGTLNKGDFRWVKDGNLSEFNGGPFCRCEWTAFNASSHRQIIDVLSDSNWSPTEKTKTLVQVEREINQLKHRKGTDPEVDIRIQELYTSLQKLEKYGYKINETNLASLPPSAPASARTLAKRILLEARRRTLTEWLNLVQPDGRIHGRFHGIGTWTHRMAHREPNTANIPNDKKEDGSTKLLGKELRSLWQAPKNRLLVGVDAEGIQLRVFAHYIEDPELTQSLIDGRKEDKTDPHSLNQRVLGSICKSRQAAKKFLYALFLGGGVGKLAEILGCSREQAEAAVDTLNKRYPGFDLLKRERIPSDAKRGFFIGLDGRRVPIPGDTIGNRKHLAMSGYLQNGEVVIMKTATVEFYPKLKEYDSLLVDLVHDEWQTETPNNMEIALAVAKLKADALVAAGERLGLKCPMAGSYWNDDKKDYTIGVNWYTTH